MTSTQAPSIPPRADGLAIAAILFALFCVLAAFGATGLIRGALEHLGAYSGAWQILFWTVIAAVALLFWPALRALKLARSANAAVAASENVVSQIRPASSRLT